MNCSVGITSWCWPDFGVGSMPEIKKAGLDALQLQVGDWEDGLPLSDKALQKEYAEAAAAAGLKLLPVSVNTVCRHPFTEGLDTPDGAIALKALDAGVEAAAGMKAEGITVPNFGSNKILDPAGRENTVLALRHACEYGLALGVNVYTENLLSPAELEQLFADCSLPNLYLLFDSHNYQLHGLDRAVDVLKTWYGRTGSHLHVKAGTREGSASLNSGNSPVEAVLAFLKEKEYAGSVVLENDYVNPPLFSRDLRYLLDDVRFVRRCMTEA
ncbi:MAG: sugar phosphate isomerase/epimerase [Clostridia bacterium]|nr:sugar phosphate isomerase/epimerase [Clostridia bacterium]